METTRQSIYEIAEGTCKEVSCSSWMIQSKEHSITVWFNPIQACNDFIENTTHLISEVIDWKEVTIHVIRWFLNGPKLETELNSTKVCHKFIKTTKTHISDLINADCGEKVTSE